MAVLSKNHHPAAAPRKRGRPAQDDTGTVPEERILALAFRMFAEQGYEGMTVRDLTRRLEVSHNLIQVRFGSKEDLWTKAVDFHIAAASIPVMEAFDEPGLQPEERLRKLLLRFCRWSAENPHLVAMTNSEARLPSWRLDYLVDAYVRPFKERLEDLLEQVGAQRPVRSIPSQALMATIVHGVGFYFGSGPLHALMDGPLAPDQVDRDVERIAEFFLAALLP